MSVHTLGRLGRLGGLAVGPLGRPAASPGFTLLGRSSLDTPDPGRSKASSPTFMKPKGLFFAACLASSLGLNLNGPKPGTLTSGMLLPALSLALLAASEICKYDTGSRLATIEDRMLLVCGRHVPACQSIQIKIEPSTELLTVLTLHPHF